MSILYGQPAAYFIIGILAKGTLILGVAWILIRSLRDRSASLRHLVWMLAFASLLILPVTEGFVPDFGVVPETARPVAEQVSGFLTEGRLSKSVPVATENPLEGDGAVQTDSRQVSEQSRAPSAANTSGGEDSAWGFMSWSWSIWLLGGWLTGCVLLLVRLGMELIHLVRIGREASEVTSRTRGDQLGRLQQQMGVDRRLHILTHPEIDMPMTWGIWRTVILLPADAGGWSAERRRVVLLHELAHIARRDYLTHLIVQLATIVHWINPLVWIGARQALTEREKASNDYVLSAGVRPSVYARQLLSTVEEMSRSSAASRVAAAMARPSKIRTRIESICRNSQDRRLVRGRHVGLLAGVMAAATVLLGAASVNPAADQRAFSLGDTDRLIVIEGRLLGANGQPMARVIIIQCSKTWESVRRFGSIPACCRRSTTVFASR